MRIAQRYHGWLVGVPIDSPDPSSAVTAWAAATIPNTHGGAIWGVGGIASDGNNPFVTTANTSGTGGIWEGGEAVIRFQPGPSLAEIRAITGRLPTGSTLTIRTWILGARVPCSWMCPARHHPALWLRWVKIARRIWLTAATSAASVRRWRGLRFHLSRSSKPQPRIGLTRTRMLLFAVPSSPSPLSALLRPAHLPSTAAGVGPGTHAARLLSPLRVGLIT